MAINHLKHHLVGTGTFKRRNNIVMRRTTHISQKPKEITDDFILRFQRLVIRMRRNRGYDLCHIGNMDETPVWMEMPGNATLDFSGEKDITVSTTGHHKERLTIILGDLADGTKLRPLVLLPGVRPPKPQDIPFGISVYMCGAKKGSWSNADITKYWLTKIWGVNNRQRRLLVWDTFRGHTTEDVKQPVRDTSTLIWYSSPQVALAKYNQLMCHGMVLSNGIWKSCMMSGILLLQKSSQDMGTQSHHPSLWC